jgi:hypothetical protein
MKKKIDLMVTTQFIITLFYSATNPYIFMNIMKNITNEYLAAAQIISCTSIVIFSTLWNKKSEKLFRFYPLFTIIETILYTALLIYMLLFKLDLRLYYIADCLICAIVTRQLYCGCIKLKTLRYKKEKEREQYDNTKNIAVALATLIGSGIAVILKLPIELMIIISFIGTVIDNGLYLIIYYKALNQKSIGG